MPNEANPASGAQPAATAGATDANLRPRSSLAVNPTVFQSPAPAAAKPQDDKGAATADESKGKTETAAAADDEVPEKFRNKTAAEIAKEYKKLESERGRMANELGQLRRTVDELLEVTIKGDKPRTKTKAAEPEEDPVTNDRLLADPDKEIKKAAKKAVKDEIDETQKRLTALEYDREVKAFEARFPTYKETMENEQFQEWIKKSQKRQKLATEAIQGSFSSAHELFEFWEEIQAEREAAKPKATETPAKADKVDDAATARPGAKGAAAAKAAQATSNKPVFKREDIRRMFNKNRSEYNRRFDEIQEAYREGRVV